MQTAALISIAASVVAFGGGFWLSDTLASKRESESTLERLQAEQSARIDMDKRIEKLDAEYFKELTNARIENDKLRADLATGTKRVSVAVRSCKAATTASVDDATSTAELDPKVAADLAGIATDGDAAIRQLTALQEWTKTVTGSTTEGVTKSQAHE